MNNEIYDYIVVGTGPAGAVIAKTLTDDKINSVLVLEAGENNDRDNAISDSTTSLKNFFPQYFWQGETIPHEGLNGKSFEWTTGRLLGGGSSIYGEQYVRPTSHVFRKWESLTSVLWSPSLAIRNFIELENYNGDTNNLNIHGYNGRINIRMTPKEPTTLSKKLVLAMEQATGFKTILDYNDPQTPLGPFHSWQLFQKLDGRRESSSTAFLSTDIMTPNGYGVKGRKLRVSFKSTALRIIFNENRDAIGIEFLKEGKFTRAFANKKVIISAGINSAQLLMISGIGPYYDLRKAGITIVFDNPSVGKYLINHTVNSATFTTNQEDISGLSSDPNALYTGGAFLPTPLSGEDQSERSIQLIGSVSDGILTLIMIYLLPKSQGSIRIQNNDPLKIVLADEGFLINPSDLEVIKSVYKSYIVNIASKLFSIDSAYQIISPTIDIINDDAKLEEFIKDNFGHAHHQQSSLKMAPLNKGGVVDPCGRVYGVNNLIVADASIIPSTVDGNTAAAAFLIGYTIAKQLLSENLCQFEPNSCKYYYLFNQSEYD
ncbi:MAG: dehydrogenase [Haloplasmataceae bacterium]|nr:dehydrogenase [Haloplasmataceae bacterium]